jgi:hypothetical protein
LLLTPTPAGDLQDWLLLLVQGSSWHPLALQMQPTVMYWRWFWQHAARLWSQPHAPCWIA